MNGQLNNIICLLIGSFMLFSWTIQAQHQVNENYIRLANKIVEHEDKISEVWPDYWPEGTPFMFMKHDSIVYLFNYPEKPEGDYKRLESEVLISELKNKSYYKESYLPEFKDRPNFFPLVYEIGDREVYAIEPKGSTEFFKIEFYIHETFHNYQRKNWVVTPGDTISIRFNEPVVKDFEVLNNVQHRALQDYERKLLIKSLWENNQTALRNNLMQILAVESIRNDILPAVAVQLINRYQRSEGAAKYVGLKSSQLANVFPKDSLLSILETGLSKSFDTYGDFPAKEQKFLRWPQYDIGGAMFLLFERLNFEDWRGKLAEGNSLYDIIRAEVKLSDTELHMLKREILKNINER